MNRFIAVLISALCFVAAPFTVLAQQPVQWKYDFNSQNTAVATYPGIAQGTSPAVGVIANSAYGDSITQGNQDGTGITWPQQYAGQTYSTTANYGYGGQTSSQIAIRMNAYAGTAKQRFASGFSIPTSGTVAITFPAGYEPCYFSSAGVLISTVVDGVTYQGLCKDNGSHVYSFTPSTYPSAPVVVPNSNQWLAVIPTGALNGCVFIEEGRNNYTDQATVMADIAASVAKVSQTTSCWGVMNVLNGAYDPVGSSTYNQIIALNSKILETYGNRTIQIREYLVSKYDPSNPADVLNFASDVPPYSLRAADLSGTVGTIANTSTCAFTTSGGNLGNQVVLTVESEKIQLTGGSSGAYTCVRGYAGTAAASHLSGVAYIGIDALHPGQNASSSTNPNCTNGYICIATLTNAWKSQNFPYSQFVTTASLGRDLQSSVPWSTPGTIGSSVPNTGAFTSLNTNSIVMNNDAGSISFNKSNGVGTAKLQVSGTGTFVQIAGAGFAANPDDTLVLGGTSSTTSRFNRIHIGNGQSTMGGKLSVRSTAVIPGHAVLAINGPFQMLQVYSAATVPVPVCDATNDNVTIIVADATAPTYLGAYVSGGSTRTPAMCVNGDGWKTY